MLNWVKLGLKYYKYIGPMKQAIEIVGNLIKSVKKNEIEKIDILVEDLAKTLYDVLPDDMLANAKMQDVTPFLQSIDDTVRAVLNTIKLGVKVIK